MSIFDDPNFGFGDPGGGGGGGFFDDILLELVSLFQTYLNAVLMYVAEALNFFLGVIKSIGGFLETLWNHFFKGLFTALIDKLKKSQIWNDLKHGHILKFLHDLRALLDQLFLAYVKPILDMLQHVRQFLLLLRLLHVKFAEKLDGWIAQVQNDIAREFLLIRGMVNNVIDLANILADPTLLLRKPTLIASLRRILPALSVVLTRRPLGYWFPSPRKNPPAGQAPVIFNLDGSLPPALRIPSTFLGTDDGLSNYQFPQLGFASTASAVDDIDALDYFDDSLYPPASCTDPATCILNAIRVSVPTYGG